MAAIKFGTLDFHRVTEVGVIPATVRPQPPCASWVENERARERKSEGEGEGGAGVDERPMCGARQSIQRAH